MNKAYFLRENMQKLFIEEIDVGNKNPSNFVFFISHKSDQGRARCKGIGEISRPNRF